LKRWQPWRIVISIGFQQPEQKRFNRLANKFNRNEPVGEEHLDLDLDIASIILGGNDVHGQMPEALLQGTTGPLDSGDAVLESHGDALGDDNLSRCLRCAQTKKQTKVIRPRRTCMRSHNSSQSASIA